MEKKIRVSHYFEYYLLRGLESIVRVLPRKAYLGLGSALGRCLYYCGIYGNVARINFGHVGINDLQQQRLILKKLYQNTVKIWLDFLGPAHSMPPYVVHNMETLKAIMARGKGSIAVLAHIGNWELLARIFGAVVGDLNVLARPMKNPLVERWLLAKRESGHVAQIYASGSLRKILTVLKRNGIVAMLIDQYAGEQGTSVPFLGKPANTVRSVAGIHYKTGCSIIFAYALLEKDNTYRVEIEEGPCLDASKMDQESFITACQKAHNDVLSDLIRKYPDQYFGWFHRRFKDTISY